MAKTKADLVAILNDDISVRGIRKTKLFFKHVPKLFAVTFPSKTDFACGGQSVYRVEYWRKLGGLDMAFAPAWYDDLDLSTRAIEAGYNIVSTNIVDVKRTGFKGTTRLMLNPYQWLIRRRNYCLYHFKHNRSYFNHLNRNPIWFPFTRWAERRSKCS